MAEIEIRDLHDKLDGLRYKQWHELWHLQQRQLELLEHLHKELSHPEERRPSRRPTSAGALVDQLAQQAGARSRCAESRSCPRRSRRSWRRASSAPRGYSVV